jgi:hypothetical protein
MRVMRGQPEVPKLHRVLHTVALIASWIRIEVVDNVKRTVHWAVL